MQLLGGSGAFSIIQIRLEQPSSLHRPLVQLCIRVFSPGAGAAGAAGAGAGAGVAGAAGGAVAGAAGIAAATFEFWPTSMRCSRAQAAVHHLRAEHARAGVAGKRDWHLKTDLLSPITAGLSVGGYSTAIRPTQTSQHFFLQCKNKN